MVGISGRSLWLIWCQKSEVRGRRTEARGQRLKNSDWERITFDLLGKSEGFLSRILAFLLSELYFHREDAKILILS